MKDTRLSTNVNLPVDEKGHLDPGAFIGHEPEFAAETIPGGVQRGDERIGAVATQSAGPAHRGDVPPEEVGWPEGHWELHHVSDDDLREAGLNR